MVIENFDPTNSNYPYKFQLCIYYIFMTLTTVGYGDLSPQKGEGQIFIMMVILYTMIYLLPTRSQELLRLIGLKSFYARREYEFNNEIPHLVITGDIVIQALKIFCLELFHEDHGNQDRHAIIMQQRDPNMDMSQFLAKP